QDPATSLCNETKNSEQWIYTPLNNAPIVTTQIRNVATGLCLTSNAAGVVSQVPCGPMGPNWNLIGGPPNNTIQDARTGLCLVNPAAKVVKTVPCGTARTERWFHL